MSGLHVAIIMDGNGRWAKMQGHVRLWGHRQGALTLKHIVKACPDLAIRYLTVYAFSSENWKRPAAEVSGIMAIFEEFLKKEIRSLHNNDVRLRIIGSREGMSHRLCDIINKAEALTQENTRMDLTIAFNYGGRQELLHVAKCLADDACKGNLNPALMSYDDIEKRLWTFPIPEPDLCIRTGGEMRLSNYLLWQMSYTELFFIADYWPTFTPEHLKKLLEEYKTRKRRFGTLLI